MLEHQDWRGGVLLRDPLGGRGRFCCPLKLASLQLLAKEPAEAAVRGWGSLLDREEASSEGLATLGQRAKVSGGALC